MERNILLAAGCSYTDKNFLSQDDSIPDSERGGWPAWPEIMSNKLNLECVNIGLSGVGNDHIFNKIIDSLNFYRDRIDTIAILWTGAERQNFFSWRLNAAAELNINLDETIAHPPAFEWLDEIGIGNVNVKYWTSKGFDRATYSWIVNNYVCKLSAIIKLAEVYGVKLLMMQGVSVLDFWTYDRLFKQGKITAKPNPGLLLKNFVKNPTIYELEKNKEKIIGWPIFDLLGGFCFDSVIESKNKVSKNDGHPNANGQKHIADLFLDRYNSVYG